MCSKKDLKTNWISIVTVEVEIVMEEMEPLKMVVSALLMK